MGLRSRIDSKLESVGYTENWTRSRISKYEDLKGGYRENPGYSFQKFMYVVTAAGFGSMVAGLALGDDALIRGGLFEIAFGYSSSYTAGKIGKGLEESYCDAKMSLESHSPKIPEKDLREVDRENTRVNLSMPDKNSGSVEKALEEAEKSMKEAEELLEA